MGGGQQTTVATRCSRRAGGAAGEGGCRTGLAQCTNPVTGGGHNQQQAAEATHEDSISTTSRAASSIFRPFNTRLWSSRSVDGAASTVGCEASTRLTVPRSATVSSSSSSAPGASQTYSPSPRSEDGVASWPRLEVPGQENEPRGRIAASITATTGAKRPRLGESRTLRAAVPANNRLDFSRLSQ